MRLNLDNWSETDEREFKERKARILKRMFKEQADNDEWSENLQVMLEKHRTTLQYND